jgi:hypothetical protein
VEEQPAVRRERGRAAPRAALATSYIASSWKLSRPWGGEEEGANGSLASFALTRPREYATLDGSKVRGRNGGLDCWPCKPHLVYTGSFYEQC